MSGDRKNWRRLKHDVTRPDKGLSEVGLMSTERIQQTPGRGRRLLGPQDCPFRPGKTESLMIDFEYQCAVCAEISSDLSLNDCSKTGHGKQTDGQINR